MVFIRTVQRDVFGSLAERAMARYLPLQARKTFHPALLRMNSLYADAHPGDRMSLTYLPGRGTELTMNGLSRGIVPGAEFSSAYFGIWLHPLSLNPDLRTALLGGTSDTPD